MEEEIKITRGDLIIALRRWDTEAKAGNWPERDDDARFADNADYLLGLIQAART